MIRAAITLKLCAYEETGAIVAALTTSIPEHAELGGRNWDYRYCWLRDAYYVVQALNRLGAADMLENYLALPAQPGGPGRKGGHMQPVYGVGLEPALTERIVDAPAGLSRHGPGARRQPGARAPAARRLRPDRAVHGAGLLRRAAAAPGHRRGLPGAGAGRRAGLRSCTTSPTPASGNSAAARAVHTYSSVMCWAACDRLANAAEALGPGRPGRPTGAAAPQTIRATHREPTPGTRSSDRYRRAASAATSWTPACCSWSTCASCAPDDPRHAGHHRGGRAGAAARPLPAALRRPDDFGEPETAFNFCTFWLIEALHLSGRGDGGARAVRGDAQPPHHGRPALGGHRPSTDGELWGNYPQTYSLVGLINCATLLSRPWSSVR